MVSITNRSSSFQIKKAKVHDVQTVLFFIKKLAEFEKLSHEVTATEEKLKNTLFNENSNAESVIAYYKNEPVGFALYFYNYSTFLGKKGLYLEDLFVLPEMRGNGFGKNIFMYLIRKAHEEKCGRFEFSVLDWNERAIKFYKRLGAEPMNDWTVFRLDNEKINKLINSEN
jgi:GNAT superfamily N-acetyltransferase